MPFYCIGIPASRGINFGTPDFSLLFFQSIPRNVKCFSSVRKGRDSSQIGRFGREKILARETGFRPERGVYRFLAAKNRRRRGGRTFGQTPTNSERPQHAPNWALLGGEFLPVSQPKATDSMPARKMVHCKLPQNANKRSA